MDIKKNLGIVFIVAGIILTMDQTHEFKGIVSIIVYYVSRYWQMIFIILGIYLLSSSKK